MFISLTRSFAFWLDLVCVVYIGVITYAFLQMDASAIPGGNVGLAITQIIELIGTAQMSDKPASLRTKRFRSSESLSMPSFRQRN
jgi:ATP-binding cassette, subfamily C (CFTR/MRP), member 4